MTFHISKGHMVRAEQSWHRRRMLGLVMASVALFGLWYLLLYRRGPEDSALLAQTVALIFGLLLVLPVMAETAEFSRAVRRTPLTVTVEAERLTVDDETFPWVGLENLSVTPAGGGRGFGRRLSIRFTCNGEKRIFFVGSDTVKGNAFPDYNLLFETLEHLRRHLENPRTPGRAAAGAREADVRLTPPHRGHSPGPPGVA